MQRPKKYHGRHCSEHSSYGMQPSPLLDEGPGPGPGILLGRGHQLIV